MRSTARRSARRSQRGAAAVEFALVMPILLALVFGIIDFGMWFSQSGTARQSVRDATRLSVVQTWPASCAGLSTTAAKVTCTVRLRTGSTADVRVNVAGTSKGSVLTVCAMKAAPSVTGMTPVPHHGYVQATTSMAIEVTTGAWVAGTSTTGTPSGQSWTWCTW